MAEWSSSSDSSSAFNHASEENTGEKIKEIESPTDDQNIVRYLIGKQNFNGLWNFDSEIIKKLTGKSLNEFRRSTNQELIVTAIIIVLLETRFSSLSSMYHGIVQKARKRLFDLLNRDNTKFQTLLDDVRRQL